MCLDMGHILHMGLCRWCRGVHVVALTIFSFLHPFPLNTPMLREVCRLLPDIWLTTYISAIGWCMQVVLRCPVQTLPAWHQAYQGASCAWQQQHLAASH